MALIAFCAIALVENVTNAHPVTREGGQREGGRDGRGVGGRAEGQEEEGRQERTKTRQKGWTRRRYKNPKQRLIQRTAHRQTTVFSVAVETTGEKRAQCNDNHNPSPTPIHHRTPGKITIGASDWLLMPSLVLAPPPSPSSRSPPHTHTGRIRHTCIQPLSSLSN